MRNDVRHQHVCVVIFLPERFLIYWASVDSLSLRELLSDSLSSLGFAPPKILVCCKPSANAFTGSLTVRGSNFNFGLAAASSENL